MKFESWLRKQKDRDDRVGDLAKDFISSKSKSIGDSFEQFSPCYEVIESYIQACDEYLLFMKKKLDLFSINDEDFEDEN